MELNELRVKRYELMSFKFDVKTQLKHFLHKG